jgi:hypothetical protein
VLLSCCSETVRTIFSYHGVGIGHELGIEARLQGFVGIRGTQLGEDITAIGRAVTLEDDLQVGAREQGLGLAKQPKVN